MQPTPRPRLIFSNDSEESAPWEDPYEYSMSSLTPHIDALHISKV